MPKYPKHFRSNWSAIAFAPLLLGSLMAGCAAVPISSSSESPLFGKKVEQKEVATVAAVGQSREEVISNLGIPTIELKDLRILVYPWIEHKGDWFLSFGARGGTTYREEDWALLVAFDDEDRVLRAGLVKREMFDSINTTARQWAEAQGLSVQPLRSSFTLLPVPKDKSLIYIFRTKPPTTLLTILGAGSWKGGPVAIATDGIYRSELHDESYFTLSMEPGRHEFVADALPPYRYVERGSIVIKAEQRRPAAITLTTLPNQTYFIELLCTSGTGGIDTSLTPKTEADALPIIKEFRPGW